MRVLVGINNWEVGGAENFAYDLIKNLSKAGHSMSLFLMDNHGFYHDKLESLLGDEAAKVKVLHRYKPAKNLDTLLWSLNGLGNKFGRKNTRDRIIKRLRRNNLNQFLKAEKIDVVNTHLFETDEFISRNSNIPHVISMHGSYDTYLDSNNRYGSVNDANINEGFRIRAEQVLNKARNIVYVADKNLEICKHIESTSIHLEKIYYGYTNASAEGTDGNVGKDVFTFGMVARGVEAKGWEVAVQSFEKLLNQTDREIKLQLLYTESDYMQALKDKFSGVPNIEFIGFVQGKAKETYQRGFDVTLLPTHDDCLPVSIIESLMLNAPVISTDVGEIKNMLQVEDHTAGVVLSLDPETGKPSQSELLSAMKGYLDNEELYLAHRNNTEICRDKFSMTNCISLYEAAYNTAIKEFENRI